MVAFGTVAMGSPPADSYNMTGLADPILSFSLSFLRRGTDARHVEAKGFSR